VIGLARASTGRNLPAARRPPFRPALRRPALRRPALRPPHPPPQAIYTRRIRIKDFFRDFDPLRKGLVTPAQWQSAFAMSGLDRLLVPAETAELIAGYTRVAPDGRAVGDYAAFLHDVALTFTRPGLERTPEAAVPSEPAGLLDRTRYQFASRDLGGAREQRVRAVLSHLRDKVLRRGMLVKPFFDDAARNKNSPCLVGHVTERQFAQGERRPPLVSLSLSLSLSHVLSLSLTFSLSLFQSPCARSAPPALSTSPPPALPPQSSTPTSASTG